MKEYHRTATIFAGVYALIQGVAWAIFAICCCAIYGCFIGYPLNSNKDHLTSSYLLYVAYFQGSCRAPPGQPLVESPAAQRTYYWMLIYGVMSALWLPTSVLLIVASVNKIGGRYGACLYAPWIINTTLIQLVDLVATIVYSIDIKNTMTVPEFENFIGHIVSVPGANGITVVPAVIMTALFSRGIIFWIINLILLAVVVQGAKSVSKVIPTSTFVQSGSRLPARDPVEARWTKATENNVVLTGIPRVNQTNRPPTPLLSRRAESPESPQSPISEVPPPAPMMREPSLRRTVSASTVYDVYGKPIGDSLPQDSPRLYHSNDPMGGEVNNQLPWSYVNPLDLKKKKQEITHMKANPKPTVPAPDYTMHFPQRGRSNLTRSDSALPGGPSRPRFRD